MPPFVFLHQYADIGLLAVRLALAAIFIAHGPPKLKNLQATAGAMGFPVWFIVLLGAGEAVSGVAMFLGLLTQVAALVIMCVMIGAIAFKTAVWKVPFMAFDKPGWEFDAIILASALLLFFVGAGAISLDARLLGIA